MSLQKNKKNLGKLITHQESEYKSRLLQTVIIHSTTVSSDTGGSPDEKPSKTFHHYKRGAGYSIYHFLFDKKIPGRLEQMALNPNYIVDFPDPEIEGLDERVQFDDEKQTYTFHLNKATNNEGKADTNLLINLCKSHLGSTEYKITNKTTLEISKENWDKLLNNLDYAQDIGDVQHNFDATDESKVPFAQIERNLAESINRQSIERVRSKITHQETEEKGITNESLEETKRAEIIDGLKRFRDDFLLNKTFIKRFTDGCGVLNTQQHFRRLANNINIYLAVLDDRNEDNSYKDRVSEKALDEDLGFQSICNEINELLLIYDGLYNEDRFSYKAAPADVKTTQTRESLAERIHTAFGCIPILCIISAIVTSLIHKAEIKLYNYENSAPISQSIRNKLGIKIKDEWRHFNHRSVKRFHHRYRDSHSLVGRKEKMQFYYDNMRWYFKILVAAFIGAVILLEIVGKICNKLGLFKGNQNLKLFFVEVTAVFYFLLVAFCIDASIGIVRDKLFSCAIATVKFVDQYLFGKMFTSLFNVVLFGIKSILKSVYKFFKRLFRNFAEHGFIEGLKKTYRDTHPLEAVNNIPKFIDELLVKHDIEDDYTYSFSRLTLNILNPIGSAIKLGKYIGGLISGKSGNEALLLDYLERINSRGTNVTNQDSEIKKARNKLLKHFLMRQNWSDLDRRYQSLFEANEEVKNRYLALMGELTNTQGQAQTFSSEALAVALAINHAGIQVTQQLNKLNTSGQDLCINNRIELIDYILNTLEENKISETINRNETCSRNTRLDYEIRNGLTTYKAVLGTHSKAIGSDHLEKLDKYFKSYFVNALHLIRRINHSTMRSESETMALFDELSIKNIGLKKYSPKVDRICGYLDLRNGNRSCLDTLADAGDGFIDTLTNPTTILCFGAFYYIALPELFDLQWLVGIDEIKEVFVDAKTTQVLLDLIGTFTFSTEKIGDLEKFAEIFSGRECMAKDLRGMSETLGYTLKKDKTKHGTVLTDILNETSSFLRRTSCFDTVLDGFSSIRRTIVSNADAIPLVSEYSVTH